jgi:hypothetical protein
MFVGHFRARLSEVNHRVCRRFIMSKRTHGHSTGRTTTVEYRAWRSMIARCTIPSASHYAEYGGRGIRVCDEWRRSFLAFFGHMGGRPSALHSVDRVDPDGHYEPGNVRWATRHEQHRNQRSNRFLVIDGVRMCVTDWSKRRLDAGWDAEAAVFAPSQNRGPRSLRRPPAYKAWVCVHCNELILGRKRANSGSCGCHRAA